MDLVCQNTQVICSVGILTYRPICLVLRHILPVSILTYTGLVLMHIYASLLLSSNIGPVWYAL